MDATIIAKLNIGLVYNLFVCLILAVGCFFVAKKVSPRFIIENNIPTFYKKYLRYFWQNVGFFWVVASISLIFSLRQDFWLDKISFYAQIFILCVAILFVLMYGISVLFRKFDFSPIIVFFGLLPPSIFLFFSYIEGFTVVEVSAWNITFEMPNLVKDIYFFVVFLPILFCFGIYFLRDFFSLLLYKNFSKIDKRDLYSAISIMIFFILTFPDITGVLFGREAVLIRVFVLVPIFISYYGFLGEIILHKIQLNEELSFFEKVFNKRPLLLKAIILIFCVSIIPILIASLLLTRLFDSILIGMELQTRDFLLTHIKGQIIIIALVVGMLTFFIGISWVRGVVTRLKVLIKGTQEISFGNFEYYIDEFGSADEIRLLGNLFNKINSYLVDYKNRVLETSNTLEEKVTQRTAELDLKNNQLKELILKNNSLLSRLEVRSEIIFENISDGLVLLDSSFVIIKHNSNFSSRFNFKNQYLENQSIYSLQELVQYKEFFEGIEKLANNELGKNEFVLTLSLNPPLVGQVEFSVSRIILKNGDNGFMILVRDITPPWGFVRDSQTYLPIKLAIIRLIDEKTKQVIDTEVSDPNGRFGFFVSTGRYFLNVVKEGYHFPPKDSKGYRGEVLDIKSRDDGAIKFDIFMDPIIDIKNFNNLDKSNFVDNSNLSQSINAKQNYQNNNIKLKTVEEFENT